MSGIRRRLLYAKPKELPNYLCFTALEDGTFTLTIPAGVTTNNLIQTSYSLDGTNWVTTVNDDSNIITITTPTIQAGEKVYWKGIGGTNARYSNSATVYSNFSSTGEYNVSGNIASLIYDDNFEGTEYSLARNPNKWLFAYVFKDSKIIDASNLILHFMKVSVRCYYGMFYGCALLTIPPTLPCKNLNQGNYAYNCYDSMFKDCINLINAPTLPATTLTDSCYNNMFENCINLTTTPELPCDTAEGYKAMFKGCTNLVNIKAIQATIGTGYAFAEMFMNCTSLTTPPNLHITSVTGGNCFNAMFKGCTSLKNAPIFSNITSFIGTDHFRETFYGCVSLLESPILPIEILWGGCYRNMFERCTNLNKITMLATDISASYALHSWVSGVQTISGIFVKHIDAAWTDIGNSGVPTNWTVIYYDPAVDKYYTDQTRETECDDHGNPI